MSLEGAFTLNRFRTRVITYITLITATILAGAYLIIAGQSLLTLGFLVALLIYLLYRLFSIVHRTNRDLTNFLLSIRFDDFETTFSQRNNPSPDKASLYKAFNLITGKFRDIRSEKEAQHQFLLTLVEKVETGLICFDEKGQTILMNRAAQKLLHKSFLPSIDSAKKIDEDLYQALIHHVPGERKLMKITVENQVMQLAILGTSISLNEQVIRIFSLQNIGSELDQQEMKSWQKLIRILTHEIMNSVSPVVSLAATTDQILSQAKGLEEQTRSDVHKAIHAIQKRGESLLDFTGKYRQLTRISQPDLAPVDLIELMDSLIILHKAELEEKQIILKKQFPKHKLNITGDASLLEQAFINLIKNAIEALTGHQDPVLEIRLYRDGDHSVVQIADTGDGIEENMIDQIFIPFFTTKKQGSGIGLSLCRQIILLHQGTIHVDSELGKGSVFTIRL